MFYLKKYLLLNIQKEIKIMVELTFILIILIICVTVLLIVYMEYCSENGVGLFANPEYEKRIKKLEKEMEKLKAED